MLNLAHEIADAIVNEGGYADDADESNRRADERDRLEAIIARTLRAELGLHQQFMANRYECPSCGALPGEPCYADCMTEAQ